MYTYGVVTRLILYNYFFQKGTNNEYEHSELLLYQNLVIQESGDLENALDHLEHFSDQIVDKLTLWENLAYLNLKLNHFDKAIKYYKRLVNRNPENTEYYKNLMEAQRYTKNEDILKFYNDYAEKFPRSIAPRRLPLNFATGDEFKRLVDKYMRKALSKGVPPLFVDLRSLYSDPDKVKMIEELIVDYINSLKFNGRYPDAVNTNPREPASALLWVYHYAAQHFDYLCQTEKALDHIDAAIEHTPTLIELFVTKGRIHKVS